MKKNNINISQNADSLRDTNYCGKNRNADVNTLRCKGSEGFGSANIRRWTDILLSVIFVLLLGSVLAVYFLKHPTELSFSERRHLAEFPEYSGNAIWRGTFFDQFESYTNDQFMLRESARALKALFRYGVLLKRENHGIYVQENSLIKRESTYKESILQKNVTAWNQISKDIFGGASFYYALIPDKNYFGIAPKMDYARFDETLTEMLSPDIRKIPFMLELSDYYQTDLHLRQEACYPLASRISEETGVEIDVLSSYRMRDIGEFYGAYAGQSALPVHPDRLIIAENDTTERVEVEVLGASKRVPVYDLKRLDDVDRYSVYLGGPEAAIRIVNPQSKNDETLVVFRDSFASAVVPYLISGYRTIYLLDLRYMNTAAVSALEIGKADDVLFLYSYTSLGSLLMK